MPTRKFTKSMVAAAILGYEEQKRQIDAEIAELRAMESETEPPSSGSESTLAKPPKRKMSAATRKAMALAQQKDGLQSGQHLSLKNLRLRNLNGS